MTRILMSAVEHIEAGRFDEAESTLNAEGGLALKTPVGRNVLGDIFLKTGRLRDALRSFDRALKMAPSFPEAHCNRGVVLQEMGRLQEALKAEDRALRFRRGYPMASYNRGNILRDLGRFEDALSAYNLALTTRRDFAEALLNRGLTYMDLDKPMEALKDFRGVLAQEPKNMAAMVGRAAALDKSSQRADAMKGVEEALEIDPDNDEALLLLNHMFRSDRKFDEALEAVDRAIAAHEDLPEAHAARASTLNDLSRFGDALEAIDRAIALAPTHAGHKITRSIVLADLGRFDEQWQALKAAEKLGAGAGPAYQYALGRALSERGDFEGARAAYEKSVELEPESKDAHYNLAFLLLTLGELEEAWPEHEWRVQRHGHPRILYEKHAPTWAGEDISDRKLLVYCEQGHGDTIQFLRFVAPTKALGANITLIVPKPLRGLVEENFPDIDVADSIGLRKDFDYQISLMSLPAIFKTSLDTLPRNIPYLRPGESHVAKWAERLGSEGTKVGVIWQGNPKYGADAHRSIPLKHYAPLAEVPGVRLISLQSFHGLDQLDDLPDGMEVERLGEEVINNPNGYREVAGVMANLDLLITSDTGPAHFAGAMGRPVWVALRDRPDWRWLVERTDSPWYPTMRLFRQKSAGDWPGVFEEIAAALAERVAGAS